MLRILLFILAFLFSSCGHREISSPLEAMRRAEAPELITDDLDLESLKRGLRDQIRNFSLREDFNLQFGPRKISSKYYMRSLEKLVLFLESGPNRDALSAHVKDNFEFWEIFGSKKWGDVFLTSYFDPVIRGSKRPINDFTQPLYRVPDDMVIIRMDAFITKFPALESIRDKLSEQKSGSGIMRGRLRPGSALGAKAEIFPYYDRDEIDAKKMLKGKQLELCYVRPIDAFILQIQGSGTVVFSDGSSLKLGYASQNGHPYVALGKFLTHAIPIEQMTLQRIESYLAGLPAAELQSYLNKNPSYVFFRELDSDSLTSNGTQVIAGRTIATDPRYFPKGALALLQFEKPQFSNTADLDPVAWTKVQRLVFDQDTGGAIRGPARLDLYWGKGPEAKQAAGVIKNWGRLMYLVPKETMLANN